MDFDFHFWIVLCCLFNVLNLNQSYRNKETQTYDSKFDGINYDIYGLGYNEESNVDANVSLQEIWQLIETFEKKLHYLDYLLSLRPRH